ncbi:MAG: patatin-like phospholipase family protein [Mariprofundaceae bacterium]
MSFFGFKDKEKKKGEFVLALSGGGVRGLAHLGVLEALEENGLKPVAIVGTSIGALFGAMYAFHPDIASVRAEVLNYMNSEAFQDLGLPALKGEGEDDEDSWLSRLGSVARQTVMYTRAITGPSVANTEALIKMTRTLCSDFDISEAMIPLYITAVRFPGGECHLFSNGDLPRAIAASMAIPGIFDPVEIDGDQFVDGALAAEIPAFEARAVSEDGQLVVAVNTGSRPDPEECPSNVITVLDWATRIKALYLRRYEKIHADILIEPLVGYTQWNDFSRIEDEIEKGRAAAREMIPELMSRLQNG